VAGIGFFQKLNRFFTVAELGIIEAQIVVGQYRILAILSIFNIGLDPAANPIFFIGLIPGGGLNLGFSASVADSGLKGFLKSFVVTFLMDVKIG
jgi:hypothetical protein